MPDSHHESDDLRGPSKDDFTRIVVTGKQKDSVTLPDGREVGPMVIASVSNGMLRRVRGGEENWR